MINEWIEMDFLFVAVIALVVGYLLGWKALARTAAPNLIDITRTQVIDRANYLHTLRRELANILISRDPNGYLQIYRSLHAEVTSFKSWRPDAVRQLLTALIAKYPDFCDFDAVGTREYILYSDGISEMDYSGIAERYRDIIQFEALSAIHTKSWKEAGLHVHTTNNEELAHLEKYVSKINETRFRQRLIAAVHEFYTRRSSSRSDIPEGGIAYETDLLEVFYVPHSFEVRWGFHFKDTNEFGLYGSFNHTGMEKDHENFYRSDRNFNDEIGLDYLHIDQLI